MQTMSRRDWTGSRAMASSGRGGRPPGRVAQGAKCHGSGLVGMATSANDDIGLETDLWAS